MQLIVWLALGLPAGWTARLIMGRERASLVWDTLAGTAGAALGGFFLSRLGLGAVAGLTLYGLMAAIICACLLLALISLFRRVL